MPMLGTHRIKAMAGSVHTWKSCGFSKANYYQEMFVPKNATAHIQISYIAFDLKT